MAVQLVIVACVATAALLCLIVFFCWKRNRRLEYKYSRLARHQSRAGGQSTASSASAGASSKTEDEAGGADCDEVELAAAESCGLDDDDEDEYDQDCQVSVTVPIIKAGKSFGLVNKIRSITSSKVRLFF